MLGRMEARGAAGGSRRVIAVLLAGLFAACADAPADDEGGGGGSGGGNPSGDLAEGCLRLCDAFSGCSAEPISEDDCLSRCLPELEPYGDAGIALVASCADCVELSGCAALEEGGRCAARCGEGAQLVGGGPGTGTPAPGQQGCDATFVIPEGEGFVSCECYAPHDCYCDCFTTGVWSDSFASNDFCDVYRTGRQDRARRGCDWPELD